MVAMSAPSSSNASIQRAVTRVKDHLVQLLTALTVVQSDTLRTQTLASAKVCRLILRLITLLVGLHGSLVERQSLASVLSPSCARPVADG